MNTFCKEKSTTTIEVIFHYRGWSLLRLYAHVLRSSQSSMLIQFSYVNMDHRRNTPRSCPLP